MSIIKLITSKQKYEKSKDSLKKAIGEIKKEAGLDKNVDKTIQNAKTENVLIVRTRSYSVGTMAVTLLGGVSATTSDYQWQYQVVTKEGTEVFTAKMETALVTDRDILTVYDMRNGGKKIGTVKQWLISVGIPLFEKETKKCTVTLEKEKVCDLKRCISFGDLEFETLDGDAEIKIKSNGNYFISYKGRKIADLQELPLKLKDGFVDSYVLEYKEEKDKQLAVVMAIALNVLNS